MKKNNILSGEDMSLEIYLKAREQARKLAHGKSQQLTYARKFIAGLITEYLPSGITPPPLNPSRHSLAREMAAIAKTLDDEMAAYLIGTTYTVMLPDDFRSNYGAFYTPPSLTQRLLDLAEKSGIDWASAKVIDPACGGGAFLAPIARRMLASLQNLTSANKIKHIESHLFGFELDPFSAWMSQVFVEKALVQDINNIRRPLKSLISVCDSLTSDSDNYEKYDLVVGNPPYGRVTLSKQEREKWTDSLYGHANLYGLFADLATRLVAPDGVIAYVTPTSFLGGQYFQALRQLLSSKTPPVAFDFIADREGVFANVLQETLLSVYKKRSGRRQVSVAYLSVKESGGIQVQQNGRYYLPSSPERPWLFPRSQDQADLVARIQQIPYRLSDYGYSVSTGPLVWNRHKKKLFQNKVSGSVPLIWAECVNPNGTGEFTFKATERNHAPWFKPGEKDGANLVSEPCVLLQRTTSLEQPRRLIAAELPLAFIAENGGKLTVENHLNMIKPKKGVEPIVSAATIAALMNSQIVDQVFRCINGSTAVSAYELESMPLPSPEDIVNLERLVRRNARKELIERTIQEMYFNVREIAAA